MIELGLLGLLILILVFSITLLRRYAPSPKNTQTFEGITRLDIESYFANTFTKAEQDFV